VASPLRMLAEFPGATLAAVGLSAIGWLGLAALQYGSEQTAPICGAAAGAALGQALRPSLFVAWGLMVLAMMGPLLGGPLHHLWHRSLARHRLRNIVLFLWTYITVWCLVYALFAVVLVGNGGFSLNTLQLLVLTTPIAAAWQFSAYKHAALLRCHLRPPLSVFGHRAWLDPIWFALRRGAWCVLSCWALMLVAFAARSLPLMLIATAISTREQVLRAPLRPRRLAWPDWIMRTRRPVAQQPASSA
jgi:predicted metal-binding membrane protein